MRHGIFMVAILASLTQSGCADSPAQQQAPPSVPDVPGPNGPPRVDAVVPVFPDSGIITWGKGYPKVVGDTLEMYGEFLPKPGWTATQGEFVYAPKGGGTRSKPIPLVVSGGHWGTKNEEGKLVPLKVPLPKGQWRLEVRVVFDGPGDNGEPAQVVMEPYGDSQYVEVK